MNSKIKSNSFIFLFLISLLLMVSEFQVWYIGPLIVILFFLNYRGEDFSSFILFTLYICLFGIYISIPYFPEIQIYRLLIIPLAVYILYKQLKIHNKNYFIFLGLAIYIFLQQVLIDIPTSVNNFSYILKIYFIISISLLTYYLVTKNKKERVVSILNYFLFLNAGIAIFEIITGNHLYFSNINNYTSTVNHSPTGFFFNQNDLGVASLLILQVVMLMENSMKKNLWTFIVATFLIFATASRTVMVLYLFFIVCYLFFSTNILKRYKKLIVISFFIFIIGVTFTVLFLDKHNIQTQNYTINKILSINKMFESRDDLYEYHFDLLVDHPFGMSATQYNELVFEKKINNSHSFLIEVSQRFGVIVLLGIVIFLLKIVFKLLKEKRFLDLIIFVITILLTNVNSTILTGFNIFWIIIVLQLVHFSEKKQEEKDEGINNSTILS